MESQEILDFWFKELDPADWWRKDPELDQAIAKRFGSIYEKARRGELFSWRTSAQGRLAEIIVLDQFSRQIFRDQARAFESDALALVLAQEAVPYLKDLSPLEQGFLLMPFMHSESLAIHEEALKLFDRPGLEKRLAYEKKHYAQIKAFGRFPFRNQALGRKSSPEELAFMAERENF